MAVEKHIDDLTIVIKTFERPGSLFALLDSIAIFYPRIPIIIIDDSECAMDESAFRDTVHYVHTDHNIGASAGRNRGVNHVKTNLLLLMDDDYIVTAASEFSLLKEALIEGGFEIAGCRIMNFGKHELTFHGVIEKDGRTVKFINEKAYPNRNGYPVYDFCVNMFMARTEFLKENTWDDDLKLGEHCEFFYRMYLKKPGQVTVRPEVVVEHYPARTLKYSQYRKKSRAYWDQATKLHNLDKMIVVRSERMLTIKNREMSYFKLFFVYLKQWLKDKKK